MTRHNAMRPALILTLALTLSGLAATAAHAGQDIAFGNDVKLNDDTSIWIAVSARHFAHDQRDVRRWHHQCKDPDDLAVVLFLAEHARTEPDYVFAMRSTGLNWWQIGLRIGVPVEAWFPTVQRNPGPPYGRAYGQWQRQGRSNPTEMALSDADTRNLVAVQLLHEYYGITVEAAMDWRASERPLREIAAREYRSRHGRGRDLSGVAVGSMVGGISGKGRSGR